jgi:hypothetical protein
MKSYTDLEQSRKLAEILPLESADMIYIPMMDIDSMSNSGFFDIPECYPFNEFKDSDTKPLPCWSLAALLGVLPTLDDRNAILCKDIRYNKWHICYHSTATLSIIDTERYDNPVDACYEMIIKLHEQKFL